MFPKLVELSSACFIYVSEVVFWVRRGCANLGSFAGWTYPCEIQVTQPISSTLCRATMQEVTTTYPILQTISWVDTPNNLYHRSKKWRSASVYSSIGPYSITHLFTPNFIFLETHASRKLSSWNKLLTNLYLKLQEKPISHYKCNTPNTELEYHAHKCKKTIK